MLVLDIQIMMAEAAHHFNALKLPPTKIFNFMTFFFFEYIQFEICAPL